MPFTKYRGAGLGGHADLPALSIIDDPTNGFFWFDDFLNTNMIDADQYQQVADGSAGFTRATDEVGGVMELSTGPTDNNEVYMAPNVDLAGMVRITQNSGNQVFFLARLKRDQIASGSIICGLAHEGEIAADFLADGQTDAAIIATSNPDFIGFITAADTDPDGFDAIYHEVGQSLDAFHVHQNIAHTWVADEYVNIALWFDGTNTIRYYVNGSQVGSDLPADTTDVPDADLLLPVIGAKASAGTTLVVSLDYWGCGMTIDRNLVGAN